MNSGKNWDAYSHRTLYDTIHGDGGFFMEDGAGVSGAAGAQDGWTELATMMDEARSQTEAALTKAGAVWEGAAADSMRSGIAPLAQWAADAHTAGTASQSSTDDHVSAYSAAKNQMPEPVKVTSTANTDAGGIPAAFTHLFGGQTDQDKQEAAAQEAKAEAVRVMNGYEGESGTARSSVGEFVPPPSVVVTVPPPQPKGGDIPQPGESGDAPGPGGNGVRSAGDTGGDTGTRPSSTSPPPGTTPSASTPAPPAPTRAPIDPGPRPDSHRPGTPLTPIGGLGPTPGGRGSSGPPTGGRGPGGGAGVGRGPGGGGAGVGRGPGGAGPGAGAPRGGMPGAGALANEPVAGRLGGGPGAAGARGAGGMGMAPMAGGRGQGDEDTEHTSPEYLKATNDSFWDDTDPVSPPVIGEDDD